VVDLSSDEEDPIPDTSRDEELAKRLFSDFNRELLRTPDDSKVIILNNSNEEEEVREEDATDIEDTPSSTMKSPTPAADADDTPEGVQDGSNDSRTPDRARGGSSSDGVEAGLP
jgi:hypothetical protein